MCAISRVRAPSLAARARGGTGRREAPELSSDDLLAEHADELGFEPVMVKSNLF